MCRVKSIKRISVLAISVLLLSLVSPTILPCSQNIITAETATVKLNKKKLNMNVGKTYTLKIVGTKKQPKFTSSNKKIATVGLSSGKITAKKKGTTTISVKVGSKKLACKVTVNPMPTNEEFAAYSWILLED